MMERFQFQARYSNWMRLRASLTQEEDDILCASWKKRWMWLMDSYRGGLWPAVLVS